MTKIPTSKKEDKNTTKANGTQKKSTVSAPYSNEYVRKNPVTSRQTLSAPINQIPTLTFQPQKTTAPIPFLTGEQLNVHSNALKNMRGVGGGSKTATTIPSVQPQGTTTKATDSFSQRQASVLSGINDKSKSALEELYRVNTEGIESATGYDKSKAYGAITTYRMHKQIEENAKNALKEQGYDNFESVYEYYSMNRDKEKTLQETEKAKEEYANSSTAGKIGKNLSTIFWSPINSLKAIPELGKKTVNEDAPLNIYSSAYRDKNISDAVREATQEEITDKAGDKAATAYNIGMSMGDSAAALPLHALSGGLSMLSLGANAATSSAKEATQRGLTKDSAVKTGVASGVIEAATEKIPMDNLFRVAKTSGVQGLKGLLKTSAKQAGIEATEEMISQAANTIADNVINGADSNYELSVHAYMSQGKSYDEAKKLATKNVLAQIGQAGIMGGISGGIMGGGAKALNYGMYNSLNPLEEAQTQVVSEPITQEQPAQAQQNITPTMTEAEIEQAKVDLFKVTGDIKRAVNNNINMYYKGDNAKELKDGIGKLIDDYASNPTEQNLTNVMKVVDSVNSAMREQKYTRKKSGVTTVYDDNLATEFNGFADSLVETAERYNGRNIADNVASNPTLTAELTPQQALRELNPLEYGENVKNSRYSTESIPNKSDLPDEVTQIFVDNPTTYNVLKNADTKAQADSVLQSSDNVYNTVSEYKRLLDEKNPTAIPLGYELSKKLIDSGDVNTAVDIIRDMSASLTKSGQFTQAAAMTLLHENPQAAMRYAIKEMDSINTAGRKQFGDKWQDISMTEEEINAFSQIKQGDTEAIKDIYDSIGKRISKEYPVTKWEKFVELTKISMLFNPRTHIRNSVSNAILLPMRSLTDRVSAIGMNVAHIINPNIKVTQSLTGSIGGKYKQGAEQVWETVKEGIVGSDNKWDDLSGSVFKKQVFKDSKIGQLGKKATVGLVDAVGNTKIVNHLAGDKISNLAKQLDKSMTGSFTENIRNLDYYLLSELEDNPFVKANFVNRLASYMKAQKITDVSQVPDEAISLATTEALKATFKDDNSFSRLLSNVKKDTGKFGEVVLPFTKTPANLAMRGIDYSPVGVINTIRHAKGNSLAATMDELSKNVVGTAAIYLGYKLAEAGLIQGALSEDKDEKEFQKRQGKQAFSVEVNGSSYTFDWAQPASIPMIIGSVLYQSISEDDESNQSQLQRLGNYALQGAGAAANAWVELSPLQSIGDIFDTSNGKTVPENALNEVLEFPIRLIPALGNAIANTRDTSQRTTFSNGDTLGSIKNYAISKIPALRETLPQTYDTWGKPVVNATSTGQAAFNSFISPGKSAVTNPTSIDSEIQRLYEETGNNAVFPRKAGWSVGDNKLTAEQYSAYQKGMGEVSYELAEQFINSESYKNMADADKADTLNKLYGFSKALYESETFGTNLSSENAKYAEMYEYGGAECLVEYMEYKNVIGKSDIDDSDKMRDIWNEKGEQGIAEYQNIRNSCLKTTSDGRQSVDKDLLMQNLINADMSEEEKGFWYRHIATQSDKEDIVYADLGYEGVYRYHIYKLEADKPSGKKNEKNGQLSRKEVINYLVTTNMSRQEKHDWYNILVPKDDIPKNPY